MPQSVDLARAGRTVRRAVRASTRDRVTTSAAGLAFHWFLAIFPAVIAALGVIGLVGLRPSSLRRLVHDVGVLLPNQVAGTIDQALRNPIGGAGGWVAVVVGVSVALWSAIESMAALQVGLDIAYDVPRDLGFVGRRLRALPLLGCTLVLGGAAFALFVLGDPIRSLFPAGSLLARSTFDGLWVAIRWVGALTLVMALLCVYYRIGPNRDRPARWVNAGAAVAAAGWMATSAAFTYYLDHFGHESRTYGTFAGVAVLLLWLFMTALAVLLGAELNRELEADQARADEARVDEAGADRAVS